MQLLPLMYSSESVHSLGSQGCRSHASPRLSPFPPAIQGLLLFRPAAPPSGAQGFLEWKKRE